MKNKRMKVLLAVLISMTLAGAAHAEKELPKLSAAEDLEKDIPVRIVKKVFIPKGYHEDLLYMAGDIWLSNGNGGEVWVLDPSTGDVKRTITPVGGFTESIAPASVGDFWVTDWDARKLYTVSIEGGRMVEKKGFPMFPQYPAGVINTPKGNFIVAWNRGWGTKYNLMRINNSGYVVPVARIMDIHEPDHMTWDGKDLWITSWYEPKVYRVDLDAMKITGYFRSPAKKTTGITWDGKYFWLTGTYDDLYQVELAGKDS